MPIIYSSLHPPCAVNTASVLEVKQGHCPIHSNYRYRESSLGGHREVRTRYLELSVPPLLEQGRNVHPSQLQGG